MRTELTGVLDQVKLSDTLLREGRQKRGFHLNNEQSYEYAQIVSGFSIDYIELTHPASSPIMFEQVEKINEMGLGIQVATHVRLDKRDVEKAIYTGVQNINTYIPIDPSNIESVRESLGAAQKNISEIAALTKKHHRGLRVSVEHAFSLPLEELAEVYGVISHTDGVDRVGIAETTGTCLPWTVQNYVETVYEVIPPEKPLQIHLHNDTGHAAGNFLNILQIIASNGRNAIFDISPGGFGERNGILSYGQVLSNLYLINKDVLMRRYAIKKYADLVQFIETNTGLEIPYNDPLNPHAFTHSAGPHLAGMLRNSCYQNIDPTDFGFKPVLNVGHAVTGWQGVQYFASTQGIHLHDDAAKQAAMDVRQRSAIEGPLPDDVLLGVIMRYQNGHHISANNNHP